MLFNIESDACPKDIFFKGLITAVKRKNLDVAGLPGTALGWEN